ncbi:hypothetical protein FACS1894216_19960 [Synergistales bacterium]|nr:hypothetical protein FACS1894216_19960 [Synergistales bacterium]
MKLTDYDKKSSLGFSWTPPEKFFTKKTDDIRKAIFAFKRGIPVYAARTLNTFERVGASDEQAKVIIEYGYGVDLPLSHIRTIDNFGRACDYLFNKLADGDWLFDKSELCGIHAITARNEVTRPGEFRSMPVSIEGSVYTPPAPEHIARVYENGIAALRQVEDISERAMAVFLFLSRAQLFENANKRTASLVMNGILMSNGYYPINIDTPPLDFLHGMADFYETADGTKMMSMLNDLAKRDAGFS